MLLVLFDGVYIYDLPENKFRPIKLITLDDLIKENLKILEPNGQPSLLTAKDRIVGTVEDSSHLEEFIDQFIPKLKEPGILKKFIRKGLDELKSQDLDKKFEILQLYGNTSISDIAKIVGLTKNQSYKIVFEARKRIQELENSDQLSDFEKKDIEYIKRAIPHMPFPSQLKATPSLNGYKEFLINMKII